MQNLVEILKTPFFRKVSNFVKKITVHYGNLGVRIVLAINYFFFFFHRLLCFVSTVWWCEGRCVFNQTNIGHVKYFKVSHTIRRKLLTSGVHKHRVSNTKCLITSTYIDYSLYLVKKIYKYINIYTLSFLFGKVNYLWL